MNRIRMSGSMKPLVKFKPSLKEKERARVRVNPECISPRAKEKGSKEPAGFAETSAIRPKIAPRKALERVRKMMGARTRAKQVDLRGHVEFVVPPGTGPGSALKRGKRKNSGRWRRENQRASNPW